MNRILNKQTHNRFYSNILISLSISIVITIITLSTVLYINFEDILLYNIYNSEKNSLIQASFSAKTMMESVKAVSYQLYFDNQTSKLSMMPLKSIPINEFNNGANTIDNYRLTSPFIHSIYVYNQNAGVFLTSSYSGFNIYNESEFYDKEIKTIINQFNSYSVLNPIARDIPFQTTSNQLELKRGYSFLFYDTTGKKTDKLYRAIIINVSEEWLQDTIRNLNNEMKDDTLIVDKNGNIILRPVNDLKNNTIADKSYIDKVLNSTRTSGYFTDKIDGSKSLIIYVKYSPLNWFYIRTIPYNTIIGKITALKYKTSAFAGIVLLFSLIISVLLTQRLYKPIKGALLKLGIIESQWNKNIKVLKSDFLKSIIYGKFDPIIEDTRQKFDQLNIKLFLDGEFILLLLKIDRYREFCRDNTLDDRNSLKKEIIKIVSEQLSVSFLNESVDLGEDHIVVLVNFKNPSTSDTSEGLESIIKTFQSMVYKKIGVSLSITISSVADSLEAVCTLYKDAINASCYRVFLGHKCTISANDYVSKSNCNYIYPANKEKALLDALMLGKISEVNVLYNEIMENASGFSYLSFHLTMSHLAFAINNALESIGRINSLNLDFNFMSFLGKLNELETLQEIDNHFYGLFINISDLLHEKKNTKHNELIGKVIDVINEKYYDYSLSVEKIAGDFKISPAYLGRLFKKQTSKSIIDYMNEVRIEKAKTLLLNTSIPVNEIAEKTGYTSAQYFYKVFKKSLSLTPNEFRQKALM